MTTFRGKKDSQDSIVESNVEVTDITSSPAVDNSAPETCDKIIYTDESYLSDLSVRNKSFISKIVHFKIIFLLFRNIVFNR